MSETSYVNATIAVVGNPTSNKGKGTEVGNQVIGLLREAGRKHGFNVIDVTGESFESSLLNARNRRNEYDYLVVVGGDGMIALGANAVGCSGKPLGIVATGSGNDFARGLELPVNRVQTAVDGIVGAIVRGTHIDVDMGLATSLQGGYAVDSSTGDELVSDSDVPLRPAVNRFYAGMLSCGLDASVNDRANHSRLPNGSLRYFAAVLVELTHMKQYGYHIKATLADGTVEEEDIISPLLTVANSRHIGGGIEDLRRIRGSLMVCLTWCGSTMCPMSSNARMRWCAPTAARSSDARCLAGSVCAISKSPARKRAMSRRS